MKHPAIIQIPTSFFQFFDILMKSFTFFFAYHSKMYGENSKRDSNKWTLKFLFKPNSIIFHNLQVDHHVGNFLGKPCKKIIETGDFRNKWNCFNSIVIWHHEECWRKNCEKFLQIDLKKPEANQVEIFVWNKNKYITVTAS